MNRVWDYIGFIVWFLGLGYIALWLIGTPGQPILPPGLHGIGLLATAFVAVRLMLLAIKRWRTPSAERAGAAPVPGARVPAAIVKTPRRKPARPLRPVKPRNHFGLRGMPR